MELGGKGGGGKSVGEKGGGGLAATFTAVVMALAAETAQAAPPEETEASGAQAIEWEIPADRPGKTDSPYTLAPGAVWLESELVSYNMENYNLEGISRHELGVFAQNWRVGVSDDVEVDVIAPHYLVAGRTQPGLGHLRQHGWSDMTVRAKINLWGNGGGQSTALGLIPFLKLPVGAAAFSNGAFEGGLGLPFDIPLAPGWSLGTLTTLALNRADEGSGYDPNVAVSANVTHALTPTLDSFVEIYNERQTGSGAATITTLDLGLIWRVSLDAGMNIGLSKQADDLNPFIGFVFRF